MFRGPGRKKPQTLSAAAMQGARASFHSRRGRATTGQPCLSNLVVESQSQHGNTAFQSILSFAKHHASRSLTQPIVCPKKKDSRPFRFPSFPPRFLLPPRSPLPSVAFSVGAWLALFFFYSRPGPCLLRHLLTNLLAQPAQEPHHGTFLLYSLGLEGLKLLSRSWSSKPRSRKRAG